MESVREMSEEDDSGERILASLNLRDGPTQVALGRFIDLFNEIDEEYGLRKLGVKVRKGSGFTGDWAMVLECKTKKDKPMLDDTANEQLANGIADESSKLGVWPDKDAQGRKTFTVMEDGNINKKRIGFEYGKVIIYMPHHDAVLDNFGQVAVALHRSMGSNPFAKRG